MITPQKAIHYERYEFKKWKPFDAETIVRKSLDIAADICVYTNRNVTIEKL